MRRVTAGLRGQNLRINAANDLNINLLPDHQLSGIGGERNTQRSPWLAGAFTYRLTG